MFPFLKCYVPPKVTNKLSLNESAINWHFVTNVINLSNWSDEWNSRHQLTFRQKANISAQHETVILKYYTMS